MTALIFEVCRKVFWRQTGRKQHPKNVSNLWFSFLNISKIPIEQKLKPIRIRKWIYVGETIRGKRAVVETLISQIVQRFRLIIS